MPAPFGKKHPAMEFGKLDDIEQVVFTLPDDPPDNEKALTGPTGQPLKVWIGATGWAERSWVGRLYPQGIRTSEYLPWYGRHFNSIELNTTHYRIPSPKQVEHWAAQVPPDFTFCPKVPQSISHSARLGQGSAQVTAFTDAVRHFGRRLGPCFLQLPPFFGLERLGLLLDFTARWPADIPLAVEFRHRTWFMPTVRKQWTGHFRRHGILTVVTDVAGRRDVAHMTLTGPALLVRFVGNDLHPTDFSRLDDWVARLQQWHARGLQQVWFFTHEPDNRHVPDLAKALGLRLKDQDWASCRYPDPDRPLPGMQGTLF